jgi:hypothetical protein
MRRAVFAIFAFSLAALAANVKLYLTDGSYQIVREYKILSDRVRYYSIERSDWEEVPLDLVDLKKTESEATARQAEIEKDAKALTEEENAEKEVRKEVQRIPQDPGVYWIDGSQTKVIANAESTVRTDKGRSILSKLAPIPVISGRGTVEIKGAHSANIFTNPEQEFYLQLSEKERFGIARLASGKGGVRVVENLTIVPVTKDVEEEVDLLPEFHKQLTNDGLLYKIWPRTALAPGEYAIVEYTEGKMNIQIWDFAIKAAK